ncbi:hypothetical protein ACQJBY_068368 [Aegilops geniculata]
MANYPPLAQSHFPGGLHIHGDPVPRPERGGGIISRTSGMDELEADFKNRALLATVQGTRPAMSAEAMVQSLARLCEVERRHVRVEVKHPADFFITFASTADCERVLASSGKFRCVGASVAFRRWHRSSQASSENLRFFCKIGIEGMPANAWEWGAVSQLINNLGGQLVEILPPEDRWQLDVTAWMRNPSRIPKMYDFEVPEPAGLPNSSDQDYPLSPPPPAPPTERLTLVHPLTIHVLDVLDRTVPFMEFCPNYEWEDDKDRTRRHDFSRFYFRGRVDGTGMGPTPYSGGHPFGGPGGLGIAGDWGGRRVKGLLAPASGLAAPYVQPRPIDADAMHGAPTRWVALGTTASGSALLGGPPSSGSLATTDVSSANGVLTPATQGTLSGASLAMDLAAHAPMVDVLHQHGGGSSSVGAAHGRSGCASTAMGSAAYVATPVLPWSVASTDVGSAACVATPPSGRVTLRQVVSPHQLSFASEACTQGVGEDGDLVCAPSHSTPTRLQLPCPALCGIVKDAPHSADGAMDTLQAVPDDEALHLKALQLPTQSGQSRSSNLSPVHTPFATPLSSSKLLPPLAPKANLDMVLGPKTAADTLLEGIGATPMPSIMGPRPAASAPVRRKKTLPPNFTPRRSARLNKNCDGANKGPYHGAQIVLLRRMGLIEAEEQVTQKAMDEYLKLFDKPLALHHIKAITALFAPDEVDFDEPAHEGFSAFSLPAVVEPCGV